MGTITIGSFNCKWLSCSVNNFINRRTIISQIIDEVGFDIIALQEIKDTYALLSLIPNGSPWSRVIDSRHPIVKSETRDSTIGHDLAFLSNKAIILDDAIGAENFQPKAPGRLVAKLMANRTYFNHPPLYARFIRSNNLPFDIRLVNVHLKIGLDASLELEHLVGHLFDTIASTSYGDSKVPYTIILGDYNLRLNSVNRVLSDRLSSGLITCQGEKTTITKTEFSSDYDHFTYRSGSFIGYPSRFDTVKAKCSHAEGSRFEHHYENISDHVPIKLEMTF